MTPSICAAEKSRRDVARPRDREEPLDCDAVVTVSRADNTSAAVTGNSNSASLTSPTFGHEDNGEFRVRFRFDSVSCVDVDQMDVTSTSALPKEPHPVRDQTVHRRSSPRDDDRQPETSSDNNIRLCLPSTSLSPRRLSGATSDTLTDGRDAAAATSPRLRWLLRRREAGQRREKPSSALKKEIKAARQLGVIMGAFTVCFLPQDHHLRDRKPLTYFKKVDDAKLEEVRVPEPSRSRDTLERMIRLSTAFTVCFLPYFVCFTVVALCADCVDTHLMTTVTWIGLLPGLDISTRR